MARLMEAHSRSLPPGRCDLHGAQTTSAIVRTRRLAPALKAGRDVSADKRRLTVETLLNRWLADYESMVKAGEKAGNTLRTYRLLVRDHIVPVLGTTRAESLTTAQVNRWLTGLDLADSTRRKCRAILVTALSWAETDELVTRNVARGSKVTAREASDR
jgi:hypothetical protein